MYQAGISAMTEKISDAQHRDSFKSGGHDLKMAGNTNGYNGSGSVNFSQEKRRFPRFDYSGPVQVNDQDHGCVRNLSTTGINFILNGDVLSRSMNISIQSSQGDPITGDVEITRILERADSREKVIGARFTKISDEAKTHIRLEFVRSKMNSFFHETRDAVLDSKIKRFFLSDVFQHVSELTQLSEEIAARHITAYSDEGYKRFSASVDHILDEGKVLEKSIDQKIVVNKLKDAFREIIAHWIYQGEIVKRAFEQPRGYPGDYFTLEKIYDNQPRSQAIGFYSDRYFLDNEYAVAVRGRKTKIQEILDDAITHSDYDKVNILDIACGPSREVRELLIKNKYGDKKICLNLLDHDEEALSFSDKNLPHLKNVSYRFIKENVLELGKSKEWKNELRDQDIIYSIGLADYLPDRVLKKMIEFCSSILREDGRFILTHKDIEQCDPAAPDWFCRWKFHPRTEKEVIVLVESSAEKGVNVADVQREESGRVIFVIAKK